MTSCSTDTLRGVTAEPVPPAADVHTTAGKLADLRNRNEAALHPGTEAALEKRHAKGQQTARERIEAFLDEGSFTETDALARHRARDFGLEQKRPLGDGVRPRIRGDDDGDASGSGYVQVDVVGAGPTSTNDPEFGRGVEDVCGHRHVGPCDDGDSSLRRLGDDLLLVGVDRHHFTEC